VELDPLLLQPTAAMVAVKSMITAIDLCTFPPQVEVIAKEENPKQAVELLATALSLIEVGIRTLVLRNSLYCCVRAKLLWCCCNELSFQAVMG
jgi:hypothetical protein